VSYAESMFRGDSRSGPGSIASSPMQPTTSCVGAADGAKVSWISFRRAMTDCFGRQRLLRVPEPLQLRIELHPGDPSVAAAPSCCPWPSRGHPRSRCRRAPEGSPRSIPDSRRVTARGHQKGRLPDGSRAGEPELCGGDEPAVRNDQRSLDRVLELRMFPGHGYVTTSSRRRDSAPAPLAMRSPRRRTNSWRGAPRPRRARAAAASEWEHAEPAVEILTELATAPIASVRSGWWRR